MSLLRQLKAKQKAEAERREVSLAKLRAQRAARTAPKSGLADLPPEVAVAIEESKPQSTEPAPVCADDAVVDLVSRLKAIRERIWRLQALFAVSLSRDCSIEADRYLQLFQVLAEQLKAKDAGALEELVRGHESLLLSPPGPIKQTIPLDTQRWCELRWEANQSPMHHAPQRPADAVPDGLGWML